MSLSLSAVRAALKTRLSTPINSSTQPLNIYDYPPDSPVLPALLILPRTVDGSYVDWQQSFGSLSAGALCRAGYTIELRVGGGQIEAAKQMDIYLSSGNAESVYDALLGDVTLGGVVKTLRVLAASQPAWYTVDGAREWLSVSIEIEVYASR